MLLRLKEEEKKMQVLKSLEPTRETQPNGDTQSWPRSSTSSQMKTVLNPFSTS